jgi:hypothetical protein
VGPSTVRGQKSKGVVRASREFLRRFGLARFGVADARVFRRALDETTRELMACLPEAARSWGLARKLLNIFLRDSLYTVYLREAYALQVAEAHYELPLDSVVAKQLRRQRELPRWPGVRHLTVQVSDEYQQAALDLARTKSIARVHLDAFFWSVSRDE